MKIFKDIYLACTTQNANDKAKIQEQSRVVCARSMMALTASTIVSCGLAIKAAFNPSGEAIALGILGTAAVLCSKELLHLSDNTRNLMAKRFQAPKLLTPELVAKRITNGTIVVGPFLERKIIEIMKS